MKNSIKAHLFILSANIIYGINYSIGKVALQYLNPFAIVFMRVLVALIIFWLLHAIFIKENIEKKDLGKLFLASLFGVAINQLLFFKGLSLTSEIHSAIIMITTPIIVLILAWIILKDKITLIKTAGIITGGVGVAMLVVSGLSDKSSPSNIIGDLFIMINATSYAIFLVLAKPLMKKYAPLTIAKWIFLFGLVLVFPFGINEFIKIEWNQIPNIALWALTVVILGATVLAYLFNILGLLYGSPTLVSVYIYTQPVIATLIAVATNTDTMTIEKIVSSILVFTGVALVSFTGNKNAEKATV